MQDVMISDCGRLNVMQLGSLYSLQEDGALFKFTPDIKDPLGEWHKEFEVAAINESATIFPRCT